MSARLMMMALLALSNAAAQVEFGAVSGSPRPVDNGPATASIAGVVVNDVTNAPIRKAQVTISGPFPGMPPTAVTDATGRFTFTHLTANTYTVAAMHATYDQNRGMILGDNQKEITVTADQHADGIELRLTPTGAITGRLIDEYGDPAEGCQVSAVSVRSTKDMQRQMHWGSNSDDRGEYRIADVPAGRYFVSEHCNGSLAAPHGFMERGDPRTPALAFVPEYYGGSAGLSGASPVVVHAGGEVRGIDFRLKTTLAITVRVIVASSQPVDLRALSVTLNSGDDMPNYGAYFDPRIGTYVTQPVAPGVYTVFAATLQAPRMFGEAVVDVHQAVPAVAQVQLNPPLSIGGTVQVDGERAETNPPQVMLQPLGTWRGAELPQATADKDGSFTLKNVIPGRWRLQVMNVPGAVRSATFGDHEISPAGFEIPAGGGGPLNIVLTTKMASLSVSVSGLDSGRKAWAMVIPRTGAENGDASLQQATMLTASAAVQVSVQPGEYRVWAIDCPQPWAITNDANLLRSLADRAKTVTVKEDTNASITVDLVTRDDLKYALDHDLR